MRQPLHDTDFYTWAREQAQALRQKDWEALETELPIETFPETCPWPIALVLDADFLPESDRPRSP